MAIEVNELWFVHSGGAANDDPLADLGGAISTAGAKRVLSQNTSALSNITGVVINDAYGNAEGAGSLSFVYNGGTGRSLAWKPYGGTTYYGDTVDSSGDYVIGSSSGYLDVTVTVGSLPVTDQVDTVYLNNVNENIFPDVPANEALVGKFEYRCIYVLNTNGSLTANTVKLWIASNTPAGDDVAIGLDPVGLNGTAVTIANGNTAPAGVTFSQPISSAAGLALGNIPTGQHYAVWIRQTVPAETRGTVIGNAFQLALSVLV